MKKMKVIAGILLFLLTTVMLCSIDEKMYIKKKHFESTEQIINILDNNELVNINKRGFGDKNSDIYNECLSKRKRLTDDDFQYVKMDIKQVEKLNDKQKKAIIKNYDKPSANYKNTDQKITRKEAVRIKATVYNSNIYCNDPEIKDEDKFWDSIITMVLIDEGEGLVIDYITEEHIDDEKAGKEL